MRFVFYLAATAGFCWGVKRAIQGAKGKERKVEESIYVLGDLVHNRDAVNDLEQEDIHVVRSMEEARDKTLLITAHGRSPKEIGQAKRIARDVLDMTCPIVQDLHRAALSLKQEGRKMVLIGMRSRPHPEIQGTVGVLDDAVHVVETFEDVERLPFNPDDAIGVVAQTTFNENRMHEIVKAIALRFKHTKFIPTICDDISEKQEELRRLSPHFDTVIVIGDKKSANATHLAEIAREELEKSTYFVLNETELRENFIQGAERIFVIAGASTPPRSITGVVDSLCGWGGRQIFDLADII
ncbi:4-hydroxy-3-methylbut-2-enyl diphosphate reductase [Candidatus Jorgensenbacteria bacterium]|nr:4-hydroxy-3-methylbut-2-enyl diphosphate reductase [Candidatus Jorgensenbacteria bacterium]